MLFAEPSAGSPAPAVPQDQPERRHTVRLAPLCSIASEIDASPSLPVISPTPPPSAQTQASAGFLPSRGTSGVRTQPPGPKHRPGRAHSVSRPQSNHPEATGTHQTLSFHQDDLAQALGLPPSCHPCNAGLQSGVALAGPGTMSTSVQHATVNSPSAGWGSCRGGHGAGTPTTAVGALSSHHSPGSPKDGRNRDPRIATRVPAKQHRASTQGINGSTRMAASVAAVSDLEAWFTRHGHAVDSGLTGPESPRSAENREGGAAASRAHHGRRGSGFPGRGARAHPGQRVERGTGMAVAAAPWCCQPSGHVSGHRVDLPDMVP